MFRIADRHDDPDPMSGVRNDQLTIRADAPKGRSMGLHRYDYQQETLGCRNSRPNSSFMPLHAQVKLHRFDRSPARATACLIPFAGPNEIETKA